MPSSSPDEALKLEAFLHRAASILTAERGINAQSRVKLAALAEDCGIPRDQFEQALRQLQASPEPTKAERRKKKRLAAFAKWLPSELTKLPHGILNAPQETLLLKVATDKLGLTVDEAREVVRDVVSREGMRRVTHAEALRYLSDSIDRKLSRATRVDYETRQTMIASAASWGLDAKLVHDVLREHTLANRARRRRRRVVIGVLGVLGGAALAGVVAAGVWLSEDREIARLGQPTAEQNAAERAPTPSPAANPSWWTMEIALGVARARAQIEGFAVVSERLRSLDVEQRAEGYVQLVDLCRRRWSDPNARESLEPLLVACLAFEPEGEAARRLGEELLAAMNVWRGDLPAAADAYEHAFWAMKVLLSALRAEGVAEQRVSELSDGLGQSLKVYVDAGVESDRLVARCCQALERLVHLQLVGEAAKQPARANSLREALAAMPVRCLTMSELESLDIQFLEAVLPAVKENWSDYELLIRQCVASRDSANVLQVVRLYEASKSRSLQRFLEPLLVLRAGAEVESSGVEAVASAVRRALGDTPSTSSDDRWLLLSRMAQSSLDGLSEPVDQDGDVRQLLQQTLELAHYNALAASLVWREPDFPQFDELVGQEPPTLEDFDAKRRVTATSRAAWERFGADRPVLSDSQYETLQRYARSIVNYESLGPSRRTNDLRWLGLLADRGGEVDPVQGAAIAEYLLAKKNLQEQSRLLELVPPVGRWKYVRLGLADGLEETELRPTEVAALLSAILGVVVDAEVDGNWKAEFRRLLLESVLMETVARRDASARNRGEPDYDAAAEMLLDSYRSRAQLLGVEVAALQAANGPSDALRLCVELAERTRGEQNEDHADALEASLDCQLTLIEYLTENDLQQTVLWQRLWVEALARVLAKRKPEQSSSAEAVLQQYVSRQAQANQLVFQLREGEAAGLRIWLLFQ